LARRCPAEPRDDRDLAAAGARPVAARLRIGDDGGCAVSRGRSLGTAMVALALVACADVVKQPSTVESPRPAPVTTANPPPGPGDAGGRSLPNRSRAATKQGHRRGDPHLLRPDRDISRKPAARERAVPGGRRVLQAEGLAWRAGRVRGAGRGRAAGREGPRRA